MNGCNASLAIIACASSDDFQSTGAHASMESTIARYGWRWYAENHIAPMVARWNPRGIVWDMPGGKVRAGSAGEGPIVFPLSRFGHLEKLNARLELCEFLGAALWLADNCDVKEQVLYTGGPMSDYGRTPRDLFPALIDGLGEWTAIEILRDSYFGLLSAHQIKTVVMDATSEAYENSSEARLMRRVNKIGGVDELGGLRVCVEGPPLRHPSTQIWMAREKIGAWQSTQAYRAQRYHREIHGTSDDLALAEMGADVPRMMGYNGACPLAIHDVNCPAERWIGDWIKQCVAGGITPCWSFLGNETICSVAEKTVVDGGAA